MRAPVLGAIIAALLLPAVRSYPNLVILDDGYFAIQIAYNIGVNFMSSFDGIHDRF